MRLADQINGYRIYETNDAVYSVVVSPAGVIKRIYKYENKEFVQIKISAAPAEIRNARFDCWV